jgi:glycosyltransferase involved in cell wall biosynthesis
MILQPKVSVIIPNYNHGKYLAQRIDSVLNQTYKNFEIILLDDCSSDNSLEVINQYATNPFVKQIVLNKKNSGTPFKQWQRGIEWATGDWIWVAESDDYADERFLEIMILATLNFVNVGLLYCDSKIVTNNVVTSESFATIKNKKFDTTRWSQDHTNEGKDEIENFILPGSTINNTSAVLFNKKILLKANPFDLNLKYIGDKYAFIKVLARSNVVYVNKCLNYYRDPFNIKHEDKFIFYFYEQFLIFNWVYRNLKLSDRKKFFVIFYRNTNFSMYKYWSKEKLSMIKNLFQVNSWLLIKCIIYNLQRPFFN